MPDTITTGAPAITRLPVKRRELLMTLKRLGEARADELASALDVSVSAVRQVLGALEGEGLVTHAELRVERGRPKHVYRLSDAGDSLFPRRYGDLTNEVLAYVADRDPTLFDDVFERRRQRRVEGAHVRLAGGSFADRVAELARILDEDGYLADFERLDDGSYRITEHNCAILDVARRYQHACSSEISFLREAMPDAQIDRVMHIVEGAHVCAYAIRPR
ncbi:MAG: ArsR family transcriptional regulator [Chloroflexi bacterium]|nr:MAG: ArsR family transcriptional regulator [Chloroflexota bacterium]